MTSPSDLHMEPLKWIEAYRSAQLQGRERNPALQALVHDGLDGIAEPFLSSKRAADVFHQIVSHSGPVAPALRSMHDAGFLDRYVPEFGAVSSLRSQDVSHHFSIGEHTLRVIEVVDELKTADPKGTKGIYVRAFQKIHRPGVLYLAALLHDVGKGKSGDHQKIGGSLVPSVCVRLHVNKRDSETIQFLVENHLLMSSTSQRRDMDDPVIIDHFVQSLGEEEHLHMLFLLTNADCRAVGPAIWNEWKETLLSELYIRSRRRFWEKALGIEQERIPSREAAQRAADFLTPHIARWELDEQVERMPPSYVRSLHPRELARHVELAHRVRVQNEAAALQWSHAAPGHSRVLIVCTRDRLGLFADIAGVLTAHGLNILSANAYTREDGIVMDFFVVVEWRGSALPTAEKEGEVEQALRCMLTAAEGRTAPDIALSKSPLKGSKERVLITASNDVSQRFTVLEVEAPDAPGLLYAISRSLSRMGLDISLARVTTEGDRAVDVFYVADARGGQIRDGDRLLAIKRRLEEDLTGRSCVAKGDK